MKPLLRKCAPPCCVISSACRARPTTRNHRRRNHAPPDQPRKKPVRQNPPQENAKTVKTRCSQNSGKTKRKDECALSAAKDAAPISPLLKAARYGRLLTAPVKVFSTCWRGQVRQTAGSACCRRYLCRLRQSRARSMVAGGAAGGFP